MPTNTTVCQAVFAEMFRLPRTRSKLLYYLALLSELIRLSDDVGATIALSLDVLFERVPALDVQALDQFTEWCVLVNALKYCMHSRWVQCNCTFIYNKSCKFSECADQYYHFSCIICMYVTFS